MNFKQLGIIVFTAVLVLNISCKSDGNKNNSTTTETSDDTYTDVMYFEMTGDQLKRPTDYRKWVYVGTPTTPNDMNNGKAAFPEFHNVYIDPESYKEWKANGTWREGTILVKELVSVGSKAAASGNGYFMGDFIGLEATIKSKKLFPNEPGNWAYFSFSNPEGDLKETAGAFPSNACNSCHSASAQDDFVFTQHYPVLRAAKNVGASTVPEDKDARPSTRTVGEWEAAVPTPESVEGGIPLGKETLFAYLKSGAYKNFKTKESGQHPSIGPHTQVGLLVRVFMDDAIASSLAANRDQHPKGASIVKEMFNKDGELAGWAVMVKTQDDTDGGLGWFWYEVTSATDANEIAAMGNGVAGCISCHNAGGRDMVKTGFPLN